MNLVRYRFSNLLSLGLYTTCRKQSLYIEQKKGDIEEAEARECTPERLPLFVPPAFYVIIIPLDFFPCVSFFIFHEDFLLPHR